MKTVTPTELRANIYRLLDEVLETGLPLEISKGGRKLRIVPVERRNRLDNLKPRPEVITGNADDLPDIHWDQEVDLDLP